jgi:hypothetical protein
MTAVVAFAAGYAATARAYPASGWYAFCPPYVDSWTVIPGGSRCVSTHALVTDQVEGEHEGGNINFCVLMKQQSDGGGANLTADSGCVYAQAIFNSNNGAVMNGYGTIINQQSDAHYHGEYHPR